ncbi:Phosphofurin acidic cluster sorting protein 2 [Trachymyrmex septentrionalis]|uniref:Phosphofurin acidic cluster sorting protein 2 n=1 Tax=Trachymyrmex septentrionalis TaxID=34720 RepID=A0A195EV99_9HYME|nr:PREDICTED: phosphofurin acidic cluster sorting protein 2 isoform X3 [Trachymyrmex septentrionalis]KYN32168.1 Phosphofurin acidic cluster sorting protein 2 [Trachymyrmex septentrionalis]
MAERTKVTAPATRPVPMKLFATWEVDRTPPNCIPRLCSLTLTRLVILRPLGSDLASISIAVKMQSSKRTLRSNEMAIPTGGILDTELELQFALQYPHFLKRDGNKLLILLQRRKRYKNRTMLGYKTLAEGIVNMAQVLQKQMDVELELISDKAEKYGGHSVPLARVNVVALSSQPVDHDKRLTNDPNERLCPEFSDEEEEFSSEGEAEGSDSEPTLEVHRRKSRGKIPTNARQRNLKQKFIALLKRFRVSEELEHDQEEIGQKLSGGDMEIEELFNELEDLSDSGPELDTMSVSSTPKPSLRPFFSSSRSLLAPPHSERGVDRQSDDSSRRADSDSHPENWTDHEANDPPNYVSGSPPKSMEQPNKSEGSERRSRLFARDRGTPGSNKSKKHSLSVDLKPSADLNNAEPRKALVEQLSRVLPDDSLLEAVSLISIADPGGAVLAAKLQERNHKVLTTASPADIRATFTCLVTRIQKFCNSSAKPPAPIKVIIAGGDSFINAVLRHYVDLLSFRPPDWQNYMKFLVVPLGSNTLTRYLSSIDTKYSKLFGDEWKELLEREGGGSSECAARASEYLATANTILLLPIAEAMVTYRETDDSSQIFIPFINDVRVGCPDSSSSTSVDLEESNISMSGSPPSLPPPSLPVPTPGKLTPPSSPNVGQPAREGWEPVELQLDYWSKQTQGEKGKSTLRQAFRALHVQRLPSLGEIPGHHLSMNFTTKEKKQKIMRLGKKKEKEKENEPKSQSVDGVTRLICSAKTHNIPLRVSIDGTEWYGVKFFQLSAQWQTHIKTFPIALLEYNPQQQTSTAT